MVAIQCCQTDDSVLVYCDLERGVTKYCFGEILHRSLCPGPYNVCCLDHGTRLTSPFFNFADCTGPLCPQFEHELYGGIHVQRRWKHRRPLVETVSRWIRSIHCHCRTPCLKVIEMCRDGLVRCRIGLTSMLDQYLGVIRTPRLTCPSILKRCTWYVMGPGKCKVVRFVVTYIVKVVLTYEHIIPRLVDGTDDVKR